MTLLRGGDGQTEAEDSAKGRRNRKRDNGHFKRQEREEEVNEVVQQLQEKHGDKYDTSRLRLWARTVCSMIHDNLDSPPDLPAFRNETGLKKAKPESFSSDVLTGAVVPLKNAFSDQSKVSILLFPADQTIKCRVGPI